MFLGWVFFTQFMGTLYAARQASFPTVVEVLSPVATLWLLWWWLRDDSKRTNTSWPVDLGMFLSIGWFVLLPYHLIRTRGWRGVSAMLAFVGVIVVASITANITAVLLWY
jgi:hypothetical protein